MKYRQKEFTDSLRYEIESKETELTRHIGQWLPRYQGMFLQQYKMLDAEITKEGTDPFQPGSSSSLVIAISDDSKELIDLHSIPIWTCERLFLGLPVNQKIPGSRIVGELLDENLHEINRELEEYIKDFLDE